LVLSSVSSVGAIVVGITVVGSTVVLSVVPFDLAESNVINAMPYTMNQLLNQFKDMVENDVLLLIDADTLEEASNFIQTKGSFAADAGKHDDIIMTLVMFSWFATTVYFEDITGDNVNKSIRDNRVIFFIKLILMDDMFRLPPSCRPSLGRPPRGNLRISGSHIFRL
jgi:hypothetical protein